MTNVGANGLCRLLQMLPVSAAGTGEIPESATRTNYIDRPQPCDILGFRIEINSRSRPIPFPKRGSLAHRNFAKNLTFVQ